MDTLRRSERPINPVTLAQPTCYQCKLPPEQVTRPAATAIGLRKATQLSCRKASLAERLPRPNLRRARFRQVPARSWRGFACDTVTRAGMTKFLAAPEVISGCPAADADVAWIVQTDPVALRRNSRSDRTAIATPRRPDSARVVVLCRTCARSHACNLPGFNAYATDAVKSYRIDFKTEQRGMTLRALVGCTRNRFVIGGRISACMHRQPDRPRAPRLPARIETEHGG